MHRVTTSKAGACSPQRIIRSRNKNFITFVETQAPFQPIINEEVVTVGADVIAGWLEANSKAVGDFLRMVKA